MKDLDDQYHDLVQKLALKRAAERALLVFIAVCIVGVVALLLFQNRELDTALKNQQAATIRHDKFVASNTKQIQDQTNQIESYLQCLGDFFAQPNRQNLTITSIQQCKFNVNAFSPTAGIVTTTPIVPPAKVPTTSEPPKTPATMPTSTQTTPATKPSGSAPSEPSFLERIFGRIRALL